MRITEVPIASPCGVDWRTMKPSDTKRFCDACKKHVHDLSAMTLRDARALLASPPTEGLCVRYMYDAHREIVFRGACLPPSMLVKAKRFARAAVGAATFPIALAACSSPMQEEVHTTMGIVACPLPPPSASPSASSSASAAQQAVPAPPVPASEKE
jgi:hypothetical protein